MESLFEKEYVNTQPLRKYEPLIRFDLDGNPQPRKPLKDAPQTSPSMKQQTEAPISKPNPSPPKSDDLKRKANEAPAPGIEPKKKQQKQTMLTSFFKKRE